LLILNIIRKNSIIAKIKEEYDKQFTLVENIAHYYNQMLNKMLTLDEMKAYETNDDLGIFFKYVKQSLYDINDLYNNDSSK
jgi:hypothetical protein